MAIEELLFTKICDAVIGALSQNVKNDFNNFLTRKKIEGRLNTAITKAIEILLPFFKNENISEQKQELLAEAIHYELSELLKNPQLIFSSSLNAQKIFETYYDKGLPKSIREENLEGIYRNILPKIIHLICTFPPALEQWKIEKYADDYKRLDDIANNIGLLVSRESNIAEGLLSIVKQTLLQDAVFELDLSGLRAASPISTYSEKCYILPAFRTEINGSNEKEIRIETEYEIGKYFTGKKIRGLIVGPAGSGKSTWSRWFHKFRLSNCDAHVSILVHLRDLVREKEYPSYHQLVRQKAGKQLQEEITADILRKWCDSGSISFILDGFDEIPPNKRDDFIVWINSLNIAIGNAGLIITSRPLTTHHIKTLTTYFYQWDLLPFDIGRIVNYIQQWYEHTKLIKEKKVEINARDLAEDWLRDDSLRPLVGIPLMLATILMVHYMDGKLPNGRAKLYERYIDGMLEIWDNRWGIRTEVKLTLEIKRAIFIELAIYMHSLELEQIGDTEIDNFLDKILPKLKIEYSTKELLTYLRERTGLLIGPGTWSFVHKNIGEFFVALAVCDSNYIDSKNNRFDRWLLFNERHNDRWNFILLFWVGLTTTKELQSFVEEAIKKKKDRDLLLAFSILYDQINNPRLPEKWRDQILLEILKHGFRKSKDIIISFNPIRLPKEEGNELNGLELDCYGLRLIGPTSFPEALWNYMYCSNISWKEASSCSKSLRLYIWLFFVSYPRNIHDLESCLSDKKWNEYIPHEWILLGMRLGLSHTILKQNKLNYKEYIDICKKYYPSYTSKFIFLLFAYYNFCIIEKHYFMRKDRIYKKTLEMIDYLSNNQVDTNWLIESKSFVNTSKKSVDVLKGFLKDLNKTIYENLVEDDEITLNVRKYIKKLILDRETLLTQK